MTGVATTVAGALLVVAALWDVFHTLWHPTGRGLLSAVVLRLVWRVSRFLGARGRQLSGPLGVGAVIMVWTLLIVVGWALIYWPQLPHGFAYGVGLDPADRVALVDALYLSAVTLATLGFGDIVPTVGWLRLITPIEALIGFGLLSAAVSWVLQVYPALTRRRTLALRLDALRHAGTTTALATVHPTTAAQILGDLAARVDQARIDLMQYAETYYFSAPSPATSLAATLGYAHDLAAAAVRSDVADVRHGGVVLAAAVDGLATILDGQYLHTGGATSEILGAYERDQA